MSVPAHVLVVCQDRIGTTMAGPAIRCVHLAAELARAGHTVTLLTTQPLDEEAIELSGVHIVASPRLGARELAGVARHHDVAVTQPLRLQLIDALHHANVRTIYDLYDPLVFEQLGSAASEDGRPRALSKAILRRDTLEMQGALKTGDAFVCASERQRDLWLGALAASGRVALDGYLADPSLADLIGVVPYGLDVEPPARGSGARIRGVAPGVQADDLLLIWAGGIWNWFDPLTVIRAVARVREANPRVRLHFLGTRHPSATQQMQMAGRAVELARELNVLDDGVTFNDAWVPYAERGEYLAEADIAAAAHFDTVETRFAFRQRYVDHFWAGLPTIATRGDALADLVERDGLGITIEYADVDGWVRAITHLADDDERAQAAARTREARDAFVWEHAAQPLVRLVEQLASGASEHTRSARSTRGQLPAYVAAQTRIQGSGTALRKIARNLRGS